MKRPFVSSAILTSCVGGGMGLGAMLAIWFGGALEVTEPEKQIRWVYENTTTTTAYNYESQEDFSYLNDNVTACARGAYSCETTTTVAPPTTQLVRVIVREPPPPPEPTPPPIEPPVDEQLEND